VNQETERVIVANNAFVFYLMQGPKVTSIKQWTVLQKVKEIFQAACPKKEIPTFVLNGMVITVMSHKSITPRHDMTPSLLFVDADVSVHAGLLPGQVCKRQGCSVQEEDGEHFGHAQCLPCRRPADKIVLLRQNALFKYCKPVLDLSLN
jgi:hypothetical protein